MMAGVKKRSGDLFDRYLFDQLEWACGDRMFFGRLLEADSRAVSDAENEILDLNASCVGLS